jgi:uncharacterized protein
MKVNNPFLITGYHSPAYFCDRTAETKRIVSALKSHRNLTLISLRRMGKTGLIHHAFHQLSKEKNFACFYIDIMPTNSLNDFVQQFSNAVLGKLDSAPEKVLKQFGSFFSNLRPSLTYDALTGQPSVEFNMQNSKYAENTLEQIFDYLQKQNRRIVIAIDEFQQIINYPEKNIEALIRANVQKLKNVNFIFSGSHKHLLLSMFTGHGRPFYQSTEMVHLESIKPEEYIKFVQMHFEKDKRKIKEEQVLPALTWCRHHTYYLQYVFNKIYGLNEKVISNEIVNNALLNILKENEIIYYNYKKLLTDYQWNLLKAIAKEGAVKMPTSKDFIRKHDLSTPSSVKTALVALLDKEMIFEDAGAYMVYDVFLSKWLERT